MQGAGGALLSRGKKALFGILAPLIFLVAAFLVVLSTSNGEGPSVGGRGMVLALVLFPIAFVVTGLLNTGVLFLSLRSRLSAFFLGLVVPVIVLILAYAYLWRVGPFQH
jgi:hypothetical protein